MNYKKTLLMSKTSFEMRGNLKQKDPLFIAKEENSKLYERLNPQGERFILHDGPPYANGDIHVGHALNKILKDIIARQKVLEGYKVEWVFGWDTHGLPIELAVMKEKEFDQTTSIETKLKAFRNYAFKQQERQQKQFKKLALLTNYDQKYLTLTNDYVTKEIEVFFEMLNQGIIYQDLKPVYWSWASHTALAEAEIEYKDVESNSIYVGFKLNNDLSALIWTTTPWTLLANVAIAFGRKIAYGVYLINDKKYVIAQDLATSLATQLGVEVTFIETFDPSIFINQNATNPLTNNPSKIVYGFHVTTESGSGVVHIAGGHGEDDFQIVKENNLPLIVAINERGHIIIESPYQDTFYLDAEQAIIEDLDKNNALVHRHRFIHSYPHDWRSKKPIVFLATKQWFVSLTSIKADLLAQIQAVRWEPSWGEKRLYKMIEDREDWCISRQRSWGVPIPILFDEKNNPLIDVKLQNAIKAGFSEGGIYWWKQLDLKAFMEMNGFNYHPDYRKETDILDVWFDSGVSNYVLYPNAISDLILEGNDQFRGWFNSSLITGFIMKKQAPYKAVISHGFVTDSKGQKMSKSIGNVIDPLEVITTSGVDILRLWVAKSNYKDNLKISDEILSQAVNDYKKIRNTLKFLLGSVKTWSIAKPSTLSVVDHITLYRLQTLLTLVKNKQQTYNFNNILKEVLTEISTGSIAYYLDYGKDFLYTHALKAPTRENVVYVQSKIFQLLIYILAPIIPVTISEAFSFVSELDSPLLAKYNFEELQTEKLAKASLELNQLRELTNKQIEQLRQNKIINSSLEVEVNLTIPSTFIMDDPKVLIQALMVANVVINPGDKLAISVTKKDTYVKCERCWKYFAPVKMVNDICQECQKTIKDLKDDLSS